MRIIHTHNLTLNCVRVECYYLLINVITSEHQYSMNRGVVRLTNGSMIIFDQSGETIR